MRNSILKSVRRDQYRLLPRSRLLSRLPVTNPWRGLGALPRDVWIIFATSLVNRAGVMALPFLVLYLTRYLGTPATLAGLALSVYGLGGIISARAKIFSYPVTDGDQSSYSMLF